MGEDVELSDSPAYTVDELYALLVKKEQRIRELEAKNQNLEETAISLAHAIEGRLKELEARAIALSQKSKSSE